MYCQLIFGTLTTKLGPMERRWQFSISFIHSSVVMWSSVASSRTPHLMSTTWTQHKTLSQLLLFIFCGRTSKTVSPLIAENNQFDTSSGRDWWQKQTYSKRTTQHSPPYTYCKQWLLRRESNLGPTSKGRRKIRR